MAAEAEADVADAAGPDPGRGTATAAEAGAATADAGAAPRLTTGLNPGADPGKIVSGHPEGMHIEQLFQMDTSSLKLLFSFLRYIL